MKIIFTKMIPLRRLAAINFSGILFTPKDIKLSSQTVNHEAIHTAQMKEMLFIFFHLWYLIEWLIRLFCEGNAYRNIAFEKEAYQNDHDNNYLNSRKPYSWFKLF